MFIHYIKIAFRNLLKYKTQNIISIIGLAVGFVCFAFSALWIRYEMSYDNFHPKADRIYRVNMALFKWNTVESGNSDVINTPYPLANWLKSNFPEIEEACAIRGKRSEPLLLLYLDQNFCKIFDLPLPEDIFLEGRTDRPIAVIPEFNNEETVKFIKDLQNWDVTIQTITPRWPANTNIQFNTIIPMTSRFTKEFDNWDFRIEFTYMEDVFDEYFKSEQALLTLLSFMTGVCILIAIFGVYSLTSLSCERRRKEIAIRKINGAEVPDIMNIFFKEYLLLLALAALAAFPTGYIIMKRWLEGYVKQTSMDAWLYILIFIAVFVVIVFSIVSMVWKAANQNPAKVVKAE